MNPPRFPFFFDECPGIQILKRLVPDLQTDEMKIRLEEFHYVRNGTTDVFAFMNHREYFKLPVLYSKLLGQDTSLVNAVVFIVLLSIINYYQLAV